MIFVFWLWRLGSWCAGHLPRHAGRKLAMAVGSLAFLALLRPRRNAAANYAQVMGRQADDPEVRRVTRGAFQNFALYLLDVMRFPYITDAELSERVVLHENEEFVRALDNHKGIIFVSAHFGNMELAGVQLAKKFAR